MDSARRATDDDVEVIAMLVASAIEEKAPQRGGELWRLREGPVEPFADGLRAVRTADDAALIVGCIDDVVVGYGLVRAERLHDGSRLAVLEQIYVQPEARGVGVGESIMGEVEAFAQSQGCIGIDSLALPGDRATKNFFETFGLVARAITVHRKLG